MRSSSPVVLFQSFYDRLRRLRHKSSPESASLLRVIEFRDLAKTFHGATGLCPILTTADGLFIRTKRGFFLRYDPSDTFGKLWGIEKTGIWEEECVSLCVSTMQQGGTFVDAGANIGYYSLAVAAGAPASRAIAFEPITKNFNLLESNIAVNMLGEKITARNIALGAENKTVSMSVRHQLSHVASADDSDGSALEDVLMTTLDSYCLANGINDVKLIKCDVEGYELFVLRGAQNVLARQRPLLLIEIETRWTRRYGYGKCDVVSFLQSVGYKNVPLPVSSIDPDSYLNAMFLFAVGT